jgi:hypothetical protein
LNDLTTHLTTILAVIVGAATSFTFTYISDRHRWRRAKSERWDRAALDTYLNFVNRIGSFVVLAHRMAAGRGFDTHESVPVDPVASNEALAAIDGKLTEDWNALMLLAPAELVTAGQSWRHAAWRLEWIARGLLSEPAEYRLASQELAEARDRFMELARQDLSVSKGPLPVIEFPPPWYPRDSNDGNV